MIDSNGPGTDGPRPDGRAADVKTPVLIVGGGPSGLAAAAELAFHDIDCILVEPRTEVSPDRPRAKTTNVRTMELFRRWGIADAVRAVAPLSASWSQHVTFCSSLVGERICDFEHAFALFDERRDLFSEAAQQVPQPSVEMVLRGHLETSENVTTWFGSSATKLSQSDSGVQAVVSRDDGTTVTVEAEYVLGCDGPNSVARRAIGAKLAGRSDSRPNFNVVFRAPGLRTPLGNAVQYWVVGSEISGLLGRLDLDGTWWAILPGIGAQQGELETIRLLRDLVGCDFEPEIVATDSWTARMLVADSFGSGRIFLVGESAHLNPPWGGHGYNTCVGDAVNVGWKLAAVLSGWGPPGLLDTYETERRGVVEATVAAAADNLAALPGDLPSDPARVREIKSPEFHSLGLVLGARYGESMAVSGGDAEVSLPPDLTSYRPSTMPGERLPHHWMPDGASLYDHLGKRYTLLCPISTPLEVMERAVSEQGWMGDIVELRTLPADYPWPGELLLVRPDQVIAWRGTDFPSHLSLLQVMHEPAHNQTTAAADAVAQPKLRRSTIERSS